MGVTIGKWVEFHCLDDCQQMGCPGHHVRMERCRITGIIVIETAWGGTMENTRVCFDANQWTAVLQAAKPDTAK